MPKKVPYGQKDAEAARRASNLRTWHEKQPGAIVGGIKKRAAKSTPVKQLKTVAKAAHTVAKKVATGIKHSVGRATQPRRKGEDLYREAPEHLRRKTEELMRRRRP